MSDLGEKSDLDLIKKIQKYDCNDSLKELISRHTPICHHIHQKYQNKMTESGVLSDGGFSEKEYIIYSTAKSYDPAKGTKYSSHLANHVRYFCLNSMKGKEVATDIDVIDSLQENGKDEFFNKQNFYLNLSYINNIINQFNDKRVKEIFELRYFSAKKHTWEKISKKVNLSIQSTITIHNKAINLLKKKLTSQSISDNI